MSTKRPWGRNFLQKEKGAQILERPDGTARERGGGFNEIIVITCNDSSRHFCSNHSQAIVGTHNHFHGTKTSIGFNIHGLPQSHDNAAS